MGVIKREVVWYLVLTFAVTYVFGAVRIAVGGGLEGFLGAVSMFVPMLAAIVVHKWIGKKRIFGRDNLGLILGRRRHLLLGPMTVFVILVGVYAVSALIKPALIPERDVLLQSLIKSSPAHARDLFTNAIVIGLLNIVVAPIINLPLFLGEEIGWRAFLYPRLLTLFGKPGLLVGGVIWGLWHVPMIIMGLNYPSHPVLGVLMMCLFCTAWGIILHYIYSRSGSVLAPSLAHGVMNWTATTATTFFLVDKELSLLLHGPTGVWGLLVVAPVAAWIYATHDFRGRAVESQVQSDVA